MSWGIAIAVSEPRRSGVAALVKILRQQEFTDNIYVFTDAGSRLPPLPGVV